MASIKLTTGRPIVIHPHYEDVGIRYNDSNNEHFVTIVPHSRERTLLVYTIYSKRPPGTIYSNLRGLGAEYVVMETSLCNAAYRDGCAFRDVSLSLSLSPSLYLLILSLSLSLLFPPLLSLFRCICIIILRILIILYSVQPLSIQSLYLLNNYTMPRSTGC